MPHKTTGIIKIIFKLIGTPNINAYLPNFEVTIDVEAQNVITKIDVQIPIYPAYLSILFLSALQFFFLIKVFIHTKGLTKIIINENSAKTMYNVGFSYHCTF